MSGCHDSRGASLTEEEPSVLQRLRAVEPPGADAIRESLPCLVDDDECGCESFGICGTRFPVATAHEMGEGPPTGWALLYWAGVALGSGRRDGDVVDQQALAGGELRLRGATEAEHQRVGLVVLLFGCLVVGLEGGVLDRLAVDLDREHVVVAPVLRVRLL